jgi:hypothetical protein
MHACGNQRDYSHATEKEPRFHHLCLEWDEN